MICDAAKSIDDVQLDIITEMASLTDVLAQYQYLVAQAKAFPAPAVCIRSDENALANCQVAVWFKVEREDGRLHFLADTDALLVKGLIALLLRVLDGRTPGEIIDVDLYFLGRTGLITHLSPARANGLAAMVEWIRASAASSPSA